MNATSFNGRGFNRGYDRGCGRGRYNCNHSYNKNTNNHQKWMNNEEIQVEVSKWSVRSKKSENRINRINLKNRLNFE